MAAPAPLPRRRWFRFSLTTMFVVMTAVAIWLGWELRFIRERQAYLQQYAARGRQCVPAAEASTIGLDRVGVPLPTVSFLRRWLGDKAIVYIGLPGEGSNPEAYDPEAQRQFVEECERLFPKVVRFQREVLRQRRPAADAATRDAP